MNVIVIGPFGLSPKSTMAVRALPLSQALAKRGHRVTMLLPPWSNPNDAGKTIEAGRVTIVNLPLPPRIPVLFHLAITLALVRLALSIRPDAVYCFKPKAYAGLSAWCLWQLRRTNAHHCRIILDADDWEGAGGWNEVESYSWIFKRFFAWQERWGLTHADAVTVASRALQTLVWALGVERGRVQYVPNGVQAAADTNRAAPYVGGVMAASPKDEATSQLAAPVALLYTRFFEFDVERVARLFAALASAIPSLHFTIAGRGFFGEDERFVRLLGEAKLGARVTALGWPPEGGLEKVFARATVALFPFDDTLLNRTKCSVKLTELLNAGVPVVGEAVGQNAEYIQDGESGLLVKSGDERCFVAAVRRLIEDDGLRERIGNGARTRMQNHFTWDTVCDVVENVLAA